MSIICKTDKISYAHVFSIQTNIIVEDWNLFFLKAVNIFGRSQRIFMQFHSSNHSAFREEKLNDLQSYSLRISRWIHHGFVTVSLYEHRTCLLNNSSLYRTSEHGNSFSVNAFNSKIKTIFWFCYSINLIFQQLSDLNTKNYFFISIFSVRHASSISYTNLFLKIKSVI